MGRAGGWPSSRALELGWGWNSVLGTRSSWNGTPPVDLGPEHAPRIQSTPGEPRKLPQPEPEPPALLRARNCSIFLFFSAKTAPTAPSQACRRLSECCCRVQPVLLSLRPSVPGLSPRGRTQRRELPVTRVPVGLW